ncbi:amino acid ABC transporter substrate-binding protein, partial [Pseudomonas sp. CrR25]|nr:amino acid ABC transporter substrate-binding protein [Pseudomonas sp. CrR25]
MRYLLLSLTLALAAPAAAEPWRVVGDEQFAPYSFVPVTDDTPKGLD